MSASTDTDVIVVGGGLVGLAAGAFLAQHGVRTTVFEKHPSTSTHPKARLVTIRSMELYRSLGIQEEIRDAGDPGKGFVIGQTLSDDLSTWIAPPAEDVESQNLSPTTPYSCDQQVLEPIVLKAARRFGADVEFDSAVLELGERADRVEATVRHAGQERIVSARFVIAADGAGSAIRRHLGVGMTGTEVPGRSVSAVFRADLSPALRGRFVDAVFCRAASTFLFARGNSGDRRWQMGTYVRPEWEDRRTEDLTDELSDLLRQATGLSGLEPDFEDVATWSTGAFVADRFRSGRIFLAGDAAHIMPPYGGMGGNTGVHDVHDAAWILAAVIRGDASHRLLDTYEGERRPIDQAIVDQALLRSRKTPGQKKPSGEIDALTLALGSRYGAPPGDEFEDPHEPSMAVGTRAPHLTLRGGGSVHDLLSPRQFTVIVDGPVTRTDTRAEFVALGMQDVAAGQRDLWAHTYGQAAGHLVRPDGVLAGAFEALADVPGLIDRALRVH
ncbi:MAG: FAD-dependent monooxygenase [Kocuria sp.]|nr:FAD-dependent monooxygenase [Kocuria sp.]